MAWTKPRSYPSNIFRGLLAKKTPMWRESGGYWTPWYHDEVPFHDHADKDDFATFSSQTIRLDDPEQHA
jgi:hypothetical protein